MKVLVTGGVGFVGTNLIKRLIKDGHDIASIDNYSSGKKENEQEGCKYIDCNLEDLYQPKLFDKKLFNILSEVDVIYHIAALARIQPSIKNPTKTIKQPNSGFYQNSPTLTRRIGGVGGSNRGSNRGS